MKLEFATKDELQALQRLFAELLRELQTRELPLPIPVPFVWPRDDQPDVAVSDDDVARRLRTSKASVERIPDRPPHFYVGRLKRSSAHQWNQWIRQRLAAAGATAPAVLPVPAETPAPKPRRGRPPKLRTAEPVPIPAPPAPRRGPGIDSLR